MPTPTGQSRPANGGPARVRRPAAGPTVFPGGVQTLLVPGAHLELAPVFLLAALALTLGLRWAADRKRSLRSARELIDVPCDAADRGAGAPG